MKILHKLGYFFGRKNAQGFPVRQDEFGKDVNVPALTDYDWSNVKDPITRKQVIKWIADLRSGNFNQTRAILKGFRGDKLCHCCLGVFADTNDLLEEQVDFTYALSVFNGSTTTLTTHDRYDDDDVHVPSTPYVLPRELQTRYYQMNDDRDMNFSQIADEIEKDFNIV